MQLCPRACPLGHLPRLIFLAMSITRDNRLRLWGGQKAERKACEPSEHHPGGRLRRSAQPKASCPRQQLRERGLQLESRERSTYALVHPMAEGQVAIGRAIDDAGLGTTELIGVQVCRSVVECYQD